MRFKATIVLSFVLVLLGAYLYFVEFPSEKKGAEEQLVAGKLFSFSTREITRIVIHRPEGVIDLEQFPEHPTTPWRIFNPVQTVANQQLGEALGALVTDIKASRLVEAKPADLVNFGLDPPRFTVIITLQKNNTEIIEIGDENLTGSDLYVRKGMGTGLYLVPAGIRKLLSKDLYAWRQREVFPYSSFDISGMRLESEKGMLELNQETEGWSMKVVRPGQRMDAAAHFRGDGTEIANLMGSLVNLRGTTFIDVNKKEKRSKLGPPLLKITVKVGKVEREAFFYRDDEDHGLIDVVTLFDFDPIFQLSEKELGTIEPPFDTYRDRRVVLLTFPEEIETLEIKRPDEAFVLKKTKGKWQIEGGNSAPLKEVREISRLLADLYNLKVASFEDTLDLASDQAGIQNPRLQLILKGKDDKSLGEIVFGKIEGEHVMASSSAQPFSFMLHKSILDRIPRKKDFSPEEKSKEQSAAEPIDP